VGIVNKRMIDEDDIFGHMPFMTMKQGDCGAGRTGKHLPENVGDQPFEAIVIELKK
jgi:hypothetical protein